MREGRLSVATELVRRSVLVQAHAFSVIVFSSDLRVCGILTAGEERGARVDKPNL